jgi:hypothetical protein
MMLKMVKIANKARLPLYTMVKSLMPGTTRNSHALQFQTLTPQDVLKDNEEGMRLPDGTFIRKGTIKATIDNIEILNRIFQLPFSSKRHAQIKEASKPIVELIPALHKVGIFDFFTIHEWLQNEKNLGRILVALLYLGKYDARLEEGDRHKIRQRLQILKMQIKEPEILERMQEITIE